MPDIEKLGLLSWTTDCFPQEEEQLSLSIYPSDRCLITLVDDPHTLHVKTSKEIVESEAKMREISNTKMEQSLMRLRIASEADLNVEEIVWNVDTNTTLICKVNPTSLSLIKGILDQYTAKILDLMRVVNEDYPIDVMGWEPISESGGHFWINLRQHGPLYHSDKFINTLAHHMSSLWNS